MAIRAVGDFETNNLSQWATIEDPGADAGGPARITLVTNNVRQGTRAARFEVRNGDEWKNTGGERAEVKDIRAPGSSTIFRMNSGGDFFVAWSSKFESFQNFEGWATFNQFHAIQGGSGYGPCIGLYFDGGITNQIRAKVNPVSAEGGNTAGHNQVIYSGVNNNMNVWHDFVMRVRWSCGADGRWQIWHKLASSSTYNSLMDYSGRTSFNWSAGCQGVYWKAGWYRAARNTGTNIVYHDGFVIADTFNEVANHAHSSTTTPPPPATIPGNIDTAQWTINSFSSQQAVGNNISMVASNVLDKRTDTWWNSQWLEAGSAHPNWINIDMGQSRRISKIYIQNQSSTGIRGWEIIGYQIWIKNNVADLRVGTADRTGSLESTPQPSFQEIVINPPVTGRYINISSTSSYPTPQTGNAGGAAITEVSAEETLAQQTPGMDRSLWSIANFSSQETTGGNFHAVNILDDNFTTPWVRRYSGTGFLDVPHPHYVDIDLGQTIWIDQLYLLNYHSSSGGGEIRHFHIYTHTTLGSLGSGSPHFTGELAILSTFQTVTIPPVQCRYIRIATHTASWPFGANITTGAVLYEVGARQTTAQVPFALISRYNTSSVVINQGRVTQWNDVAGTNHFKQFVPEENEPLSAPAWDASVMAVRGDGASALYVDSPIVSGGKQRTLFVLLRKFPTSDISFSVSLGDADNTPGGSFQLRNYPGIDVNNQKSAFYTVTWQDGKFHLLRIQLHSNNLNTTRFFFDGTEAAIVYRDDQVLNTSGPSALFARPSMGTMGWFSRDWIRELRIYEGIPTQAQVTTIQNEMLALVPEYSARIDGDFYVPQVISSVTHEANLPEYSSSISGSLSRISAAMEVAEEALPANISAILFNFQISSIVEYIQQPDYQPSEHVIAPVSRRVTFSRESREIIIK